MPQGELHSIVVLSLGRNGHKHLRMKIVSLFPINEGIMGAEQLHLLLKCSIAIICSMSIKLGLRVSFFIWA